jgi:group I intron endonuclease
MANQQPRQVMQDWIIYSITNSVTGEVYIGQTRKGLHRRKGEHISRSNLGERDHKLYRAMRQYGVENFVFAVVCTADKPEDLDRLEIEYISKFKSAERGYNMTCGGNSPTDETRQKLRAIMLGRKITWYDKIVASRVANPNRKKAKDFVAKGSANVNSKSYQVRFPDGSERVISGLNQFCKEHGLTKKCLLDILDGKQKTHKGFTLLARFNDHPAREYDQAVGKGAQPVALTG